jgi:acylglycerol lipase
VIGIWAGQQNLVSDLRQFVEAVTKRHRGRPLYIMGESMGGAVAVAALSDPTFPRPQGLILVAPALWGGDTMPLLYRGSLWLMAHTMPFDELTGKHLKIQASDNLPMLRRLQRDPLILKTSRVDSVYGLVDLMDAAHDRVPELSVPVLLLYGAKDEVIPKEPIESALKRFSHPVVYAYYPDGYHMLLRDIEGRRVMDDILSWMKSPAARLPSGMDVGYIQTTPMVND